jgi:deoxycytidylate deaminase
MKDKFLKKYMRLAKLIGEDQNPCLSRSIGVVIVDPVKNRVLGAGYNGPPRDTPHPDDPEYLEKIVWPQLTRGEKETALVSNKKMTAYVFKDCYDDDKKAAFIKAYSHSGVCPRRAVGAKSGDRLELCSCEHAEKNAIANAAQSVWGAWAFCWCGVPCWDCTKLIINSGIAKVICFDWGKDYSLGSRWLFEKAGVEIDIREPEFFLED